MPDEAGAARVQAPGALAEWRCGWPLSLAAMLGIYAAVLYVYTTGLFIAPLQQEFGWDRTRVTGGMLLVGIVAAIGNPVVGRLLDRLPAAGIARVGAIAQAASLALLAASGRDGLVWWIGWTLVAVSALVISVPVWLVGVVRHFDIARGKALALGYCGSSLAAMTVPLFTKVLIAAFGWRGAYLGIGALALVAAGAAALILTLSETAAGPVRAPAAPSGGGRAREALRGTVFWRIALMSVIVTLGVIGLTVHFVPICEDAGIDRTTAATLAGLIGLSGIVGRLAAGALLDRFAARLTGAAIFLVPALACLGLWLGHPGPVGLAFVALAVGVALGAELDIMAYVTGRFFGLADYGFLFGILTGIVGCAAGFGPVVASLLRDFTGSYATLAFVLMLSFGAASVLVGTLPDQGQPARGGVSAIPAH